MAHDRVIAVLESRIYAGGLPRRVAAFPGPGNPARWTGLVETESAFLLYDYDLLMPFDPASGRQFYKPENNPAMDAARNTDTFRVFLDFSKFTLWRVMPAPDGSAIVAAYDLRFGDPSRPGFVATALLGPAGRVEEERFSFGGAAGPSAEVIEQARARHLGAGRQRSLLLRLALLQLEDALRDVGILEIGGLLLEFEGYPGTEILCFGDFVLYVPVKREFAIQVRGGCIDAIDGG